MQLADSLKLICVAATGTNNIDLAAAAEQKITVCNARGYATTSVVEHVFSLILALTRHLHEYQTAVNKGRWHTAESFCLLDYPSGNWQARPWALSATENWVVQRRHGQGIRDERSWLHNGRGVNPQAGRIPLEQLLSQSDIISLHCPLTDTTRNLIDQREFALMGKDTLLINTARGGIVNEIALRQALQSGQIAGAAIDVLSEEPPRQGNPLLDEPVPNLIVTPHIAWASITARQSLINELTENIHAFLKGRPRNVVHA